MTRALPVIVGMLLVATIGVLGLELEHDRSWESVFVVFVLTSLVLAAVAVSIVLLNRPRRLVPPGAPALRAGRARGVVPRRAAQSSAPPDVASAGSGGAR